VRAQRYGGPSHFAGRSLLVACSCMHGWLRLHAAASTISAASSSSCSDVWQQQLLRRPRARTTSLLMTRWPAGSPTRETHWAVARSDGAGVVRSVF
jgi:hypothetical protein